MSWRVGGTRAVVRVIGRTQYLVEIRLDKSDIEVLISSTMLRLGLIICSALAFTASSSRAAEPTYRFAIPPAPVADVIAAFTAITGVSVDVTAVDGIGTLPSPAKRWARSGGASSTRNGPHPRESNHERTAYAGASE